MRPAADADSHAPRAAHAADELAPGEHHAAPATTSLGDGDDVERAAAETTTDAAASAAASPRASSAPPPPPATRRAPRTRPTSPRPAGTMPRL